MLTVDDRLFIDRIRGLSIMRVVLVHLGLAWIYPPYTRFIHAFLPVLFFVSGVVSYGSYVRSDNTKSFLKKRIGSIIIPYYVFIAFVFLFHSLENKININISLKHLFLWLTFAPSNKTMPFPIGQVWFIHSLVIIAIMSPLVFKIVERNKIFIFFPIIMSFILSTWQTYEPVSKNLNIFNHNMYQPFVNCSFFFFGSAYFLYLNKIKGKILISLSTIFLSISVCVFYYLNLSLDLSEYVYAPNSYYLSSSFFCITIILLLKQQINKLLDKLNILNTVVLFFNKNAYAIFLNHSFFIFALERWAGLVGVMGNPALAILKIILVFSLSCLFAIPMSWIANSLKVYFIGEKQLSRL